MILSEKSKDRVINWFITGERGISSESLAGVALGKDCAISFPRDPADFRRCVNFLNLLTMHEAKDLLREIAGMHECWKVIWNNYVELMDLYMKECEQKTAPKLYAKMKELGL
jgi:hypothetical protein